MDEKDGDQSTIGVKRGRQSSTSNSTTPKDTKATLSSEEIEENKEGTEVKLTTGIQNADKTDHSQSEKNALDISENSSVKKAFVNENEENAATEEKKEEGGDKSRDCQDGTGIKDSNNTSSVDDTNIKSVDSGLPDSEDELYLKDVNLGFDDEDNLKEPLKGFTEVHEATLFPMVDEQSMLLYEIVQTMESKQMASDIASILSHKEPIVVPRSKYLLPGGGDISMRIISTESPEKTILEKSIWKSDSSDSTEVNFSPEKLTLLLKPLNNGWKREIVMRSEGSSGRKTGDVYYYTPENIKLRSSKQVAQYLAKNPSFGMTANNFSFAKGRISQDPAKEIIRTAFDGKSTPMRGKSNQKSDIGSDDAEDDLDLDKGISKPMISKSSSSRRSIQPPKRYATGESVFYPDKKTKISSKASDRDREVNDNMMEMGMLPPKYPKGKEDTSNSGTPLTLSPDSQQEVRRRGRPPKPGGKKDLLVQAQALAAAQEAAGICNESDDNDSMFQISAFRQSHSLMEAAIEQYQEMQDMEIDSDSGNSGNPSVPTVEENAFGGYNQNSEQLLPCSIRCAGMTGEIPTLQCKRCLCLYHPECLGLPPNLNFKNFLCSNCEGEPPEERMVSAVPGLNVKSKQPEVKKSSLETKKDVKKPPPPLIRANFPKLQNKFMNEMRARLPPPSRLPLLHPSVQFGRGGIRIRQKTDIPKLTSPQFSMLRPGNSDVTMSISPISMKRSRGRPPKNSKLIPQLSRNLTITPISIPKKMPPPPVPNLHPVGPVGIFPKRSASVKPDWLFSKTNKGAIAKAIANIKSTTNAPPQKLKLLQQKKSEKSPETSLQILQQQKELNKDKMKVPVDNSPSPPAAAFRRYTQSVVTIGQKKFIVIPRNTDRVTKVTPETESTINSAETTETEDTETASLANNVEPHTVEESSAEPPIVSTPDVELNNISTLDSVDVKVTESSE